MSADSAILTGDDQPATAQPEVSEPTRSAFHFSGTGADFFKIWLVNISLSVLTLGIYSAWAKVRVRRYLYGHTRLDTSHHASGFEYLASPITLLKSRLVAIALLAAYTLAANLLVYAAWGLLALLYVVIPWAIYRSWRFNARVTRFRNVRFDFSGTTKGAYRTYLAWPILSILTLGLLYPVAKHAQLHYRIDALHFGNQATSNPSRVKSFFGMYLKGTALWILAGLLAGVIMVFFVWTLISSLGGPEAFENPSSLAIGLEQTSPLLVIALVFIWLLVHWPLSYFAARRHQLTFNGTEIGLHRLGSAVTTWGLYKCQFLYLLLMPVTLGFVWPWLRVAVARYKAAQTWVELSTDLDEIEDHSTAAASAIGEEFGDVFDIGI